MTATAVAGLSWRPSWEWAERPCSSGCVPHNDAIGLAALVLLFGLRTLQGFAAGDEVTGAATYIAECVPAEKRGFYGAFNPAGVALGFGLASGLAGVTAGLVGNDGLSAGGWRMPFLLGGILVAITFYLRTRMENTPQFQELQAAHKHQARPCERRLRANSERWSKPF